MSHHRTSSVCIGRRVDHHLLVECFIVIQEQLGLGVTDSVVFINGVLENGCTEPLGDRHEQDSPGTNVKLHVLGDVEWIFITIIACNLQNLQQSERLLDVCDAVNDCSNKPTVRINRRFQSSLK